jgi:hypothetical protein
MNEEVLSLAQIVWDYLAVRDEPVPADVLVALGTNDLRVADFAAGLYLRGYAPLIVCSGGVAHQGDLLETPWDRTEAEMYAEVAQSRGVPRERILLEPNATNTAENLRFTRRLLADRGIAAGSILIAVKPFMGRRVRAALPVEWPGMPARVVSDRISMRDYFTQELPPEKVIHIMMGDLQRVWVYARRGWSAPQPLPDRVRGAFERLSALGFTQHLISET